MGERGAGAISEAMSINSALQELDIGSNAIMDSGFLVVVNALGSSSLVKLLCRVNQIGKFSANCLVLLSCLIRSVRCARTCCRDSEAAAPSRVALVGQ